MANVFGPRLGLLFNANIGEYYADNFRVFLQALDQLIMGSVINSTTAVPPSTPNPGDAYLLSTGTPSGAWTGQAGNIAVWDTQVTNSGTNTQVPAWVFYTPKPGWTLWNVATASLTVYNGTAWVAIGSGGSGATFPINDDITQMTALNSGSSNTALTINGSGGNAIFVTDGVHDSGWTPQGVITATQFITTGQVTCGSVLCSGPLVVSNISNGNPGSPIVVTQSGGGPTSLVINGNTVSNQCLLGFASYPVQTTVGAAGGASALPATPTEYIQVSVNGNLRLIPTYAA